MPLTKVISPNNSAKQRFKCTKWCDVEKTFFLQMIMTFKAYSIIHTYLKAISIIIVNRRQAIDIAHPI